MPIVQPAYQTTSDVSATFNAVLPNTVVAKATGEYGIILNLNPPISSSPTITASTNYVGALFVGAQVYSNGIITGVSVYYYDALGTKIILGQSGTGVPVGVVAAKVKMSISVNSPSQITVYLETSDLNNAAVTGTAFYNSSFTVNLAAPYLLNTDGKLWGVYSQPYVTPMLSTLPRITELYAAKYNALQFSTAARSAKKHFQTQDFANNIVRNIPNSTPHYYWESNPMAKGVKIYDVKHELAPAIFNFANKLMIPTYDLATASAVTTGVRNTLQPANDGDIGKSGIFFTPFRSRFMVYHDSKDTQKGLLWLCPPANTNSNIAPLALLSKFAYPSAEKTITRIVDSNYTNNTIEIQTDWIKDDGQINKILANLVKGSNSFNSEFEIRIFGNPLVQVGDFAQITYSLKRMGYDPDDATVKPVVCLVKAVSQSFDGGLQETALTLKPMIAS
jgi:hypothetical protein